MLPVSLSMIAIPVSTIRGHAIRMYDISKQQFCGTVYGKMCLHPTTSVDMTKDGAVAAHTADTVWVFDLNEKERLDKPFQPDSKRIEGWKKRGGGGYAPSACAFRSDGARLAVGTRAGRVLLFDVPDATLRGMKSVGDGIAFLSGSVRNIAFLGDTDYLVVQGRVFRVLDCERMKWLDDIGASEAVKSIEPYSHIASMAVHEHAIYLCGHQGQIAKLVWTIGPG